MIEVAQPIRKEQAVYGKLVGMATDISYQSTVAPRTAAKQAAKIARYRYS